MRFTKQFWEGIADRSITVAFRRWAKPTVVEGRAYRTGGGRVEVVSVAESDEDKISVADAKLAGYETVEELLDNLRPGEDRRLYRVDFTLLDEPDPREQLAAACDLSFDDVAEISARLERYDRASKHGPWTAATLALILEHPARRAPDLAEMVGRETQPFKLDVRKLKNLGLTHSLKIGYTLSPRGEAFLKAVNS